MFKEVIAAFGRRRPIRIGHWLIVAMALIDFNGVRLPL
jgi:hypothetical protein